MLGKFGETLVVDWGLAKPLGRCFAQEGAVAAGILVSRITRGRGPTLVSDGEADDSAGASRPDRPSHPGRSGRSLPASLGTVVGDDRGLPRGNARRS